MEIKIKKHSDYITTDDMEDFPNTMDGMRAYWDHKLLETLEIPPMFANVVVEHRKKNFKDKIKDWFLNKFADLYVRVRGDYDD